MKVLILAGSMMLFLSPAFVKAQDITTRSSFERGVMLAKAGNFEKALSEFESSLGAASSTHISDRLRAQIHFNIGVCQYRLQRTAAAAAELKIAIALRPDYQKAFYVLGVTEAERRNWRAATTALLAATRIDTHDAEAWFDLGNAYLERKEPDKAKTAFELAAKYKSIDSAVSHNNIGVILALSGDIKKAVAEFELALKASGGELETARHNLSVCQFIARETLAAELRFGARSSALEIN